MEIKNKLRKWFKIDEIKVWFNTKEERLDLYDKYHNKSRFGKYCLFVAAFDLVLVLGLSIGLSNYDRWQDTSYYEDYLASFFFDLFMFFLLVFFLAGCFFYFGSITILESKNAGVYLDSLASFSEVKVYSEIQQHLIQVDKLIQQLRDEKKWKNDEEDEQEERT